MTIPKAILKLKRIKKLWAVASEPELLEAVDLGIEALKAWKEDREGLSEGEYELLPGETEKK